LFNVFRDNCRQGGNFVEPAESWRFIQPKQPGAPLTEAMAMAQVMMEKMEFIMVDFDDVSMILIALND
jgi:hypothetical protein